MNEQGIVYLVGAGPGDLGLITVRGLNCIEKSDVIVYDQLVNEFLLQYANPQAELINVGKTAGKHTLPQDKINQLLVDKAREGKIVCRLKGGDPFIFGRGAEEGECLFDAGISFEIIPGISSSIAVPAYAGIPVTHRECVSGFTVVTGHEDPLKNESLVNWEQLSKSGNTLVILMGMGNISAIMKHLISGGLSEDTPVAVIHRGTTPNQKTIIGNLNTIVGDVEKAGVTHPVVIVVGNVVNYREKLNWFENRPLLGKKILVTRTRQQIGKLSALLQEQGATVLEYPTIQITSLSDYTLLDKAISNLCQYDWVLFTSQNGVEYFFNYLMEKRNLDTRSLGSAKVGVIGPATALELKKYGITSDCIPDEYVAESLLKKLDEYDLKNKKVLILRALSARDVLPEGLRMRGALVDVVPVYETKPAVPDRGICEQWSSVINLPDVVTFTSSSTVTNFIKMTPVHVLDLMKGKTIFASIGPITSKTMEENKLKVSIEASEYTIAGLVKAIQFYFQQKK